MDDIDTEDQEILRESHDRLQECLDWESTARERWRQDYSFGFGDADNNYQWPDHLLRDRQLSSRPALTINKVRQHCLHILNDMRNANLGVNIVPDGSDASSEAAKVLEDIVRRIEYQSNATEAYMHAAKGQVFGGIGYWRVVTEYQDDKSFDQEIYIRPILHPLMVTMDPGIQQTDGSDARYAFVFEDLPDREFKQRYPDYADLIKPNSQPFGDPQTSHRPDTVRICEYFRRGKIPDELIKATTGEIYWASELSPTLRDGLKKDPGTMSRKTTRDTVEWYLIVGNEIVDRRDWPGKYIPIVRVVGEETVIDGTLDRMGHVRALKDPQRMYNYWASSAVEYVALQTKAPFIMPVESIEGYEDYWYNANRVNYAVLPYKAMSDAGMQLPAPQRSPPVQAPEAYLMGMQAASGEMMWVSGQYQSQLGAQGNEVSGAAIAERQEQGDNATYHYLAGLGTAIRFTARILIDLIPKVYDTQRVLRIARDDGTLANVHVNPLAPTAFAQAEHAQTQDVAAILNPRIGSYLVQANIGPAYATRRQAALQGMLDLAKLNPQFLQAAGDLLVKAADFPMADEISERLHNLLPPEALGGPKQAVTALQQELQQAKLKIQAMDLQNQDKRALTSEREAQKIIDAYKAETDRAKALAAVLPPDVLQLIGQQLAQQILGTHLSPVRNTADAVLAPQPAVPTPELAQSQPAQPPANPPGAQP